MIRMVKVPVTPLLGIHVRYRVIEIFIDKHLNSYNKIDSSNTKTTVTLREINVCVS